MYKDPARNPTSTSPFVSRGQQIIIYNLANGRGTGKYRAFDTQKSRAYDLLFVALLIYSAFENFTKSRAFEEVPLFTVL